MPKLSLPCNYEKRSMPALHKMTKWRQMLNVWFWACDKAQSICKNVHKPYSKAVIEGDVMLHYSAILGSVIVLFSLVLLYTIIINLLWFNLEKPSSCSFPKLPLTNKDGEMLSLAIKPLETSRKILRAEWNITDTFSFLSFAFWQIGKEKKMPFSGNCFTLLFLIFHMKGFYLSTGGSRKAGFLWSRYIHPSPLQLVAWSTAIISGVSILLDSENK